MLDDDRGLLVRGIAAARAGDIDEAKKYLEWALRRHPSMDVEFDVYFWLAKIETDPARKREQLESALAINPLEPRARRALAILDGRISPDQIINPDHLPEVKTGDQATADRFDCPNCGGRMHYSADGLSLICEYCEMTGMKDASAEEPSPNEQDFILGLATIKGHTHKVTARSFTCEACGANYILPPEALTLSCHHCGSVYVVRETETSTWIAPQGVIPFLITQKEAENAIRETLLESYKITPKTGDRPPVGVYLPIWTFDLGGMITWRSFNRDDDSIPRPSQGFYPVAIDDLAIPASDHMSELQRAELGQFDLRSAEPYDPSFLVNWPAETYQISLAEAALEARQQAFDSLKPTVAHTTGSSNSSLSSAEMRIVSYKLVLVPLWIGRYEREELRVEIIVNGQTGMVHNSLLAGP